MDLTIDKRYYIITSRGHIEAHVVQPNVAIFASDYRKQRWHDRTDCLYVGGQFDGGEVLSIEERQ